MTIGLRALAVGLLVLALAAVPAGRAAAQPVTGLKPAEPQPAPAQLAPGLAVQYAYALVNHLDDFKGKKFEPGPPVAHLDWKMGSGIVLTSRAKEGVCALLTGLIQLDKPGTYGIEVTSNDGVRLEIGGQLVHEDPGVHADTTSDRIDVKVDRPGWYPISIAYFQKRNTATLIVRWIGPGEKGTLVPIPAKALAHRK